MLSEDPKFEPATRASFRTCAPGYFRLRLHISYDGTDFAGWQRQTRHASIQGTIENALARIYGPDGAPITLLGASRTDSGVHAHQQVAHFDAPRDPSGFDLRYAIQCLTPPSIVVKDIFHAPDDFHAIASGTDKIYKYYVLNRWVPSALRHRYTYWVRAPLDLDYLNAASKFLLGKQDFKSFQSTGTPVQSTVREIREAHWDAVNADTLVFTIRGNGFLKQMVRNIVGTLIDLNQAHALPEQVLEILRAGDRRKAGPTAPPQGLFLHRVNYPDFVDNKCRKL